MNTIKSFRLFTESLTSLSEAELVINLFKDGVKQCVKTDFPKMERTQRANVSAPNLSTVQANGYTMRITRNQIGDAVRVEGFGEEAEVVVYNSRLNMLVNSISKWVPSYAEYPEERTSVKKDAVRYAKEIESYDYSTLLRELVPAIEQCKMLRGKVLPGYERVLNAMYRNDYSAEANRKHLKAFTAKDGNEYYMHVSFNTDNHRITVYDNSVQEVAVAYFDVQPTHFSGHTHTESIEVQPAYRRLGIARAITDFAEEFYGVPYKPSSVLSPEMTAFVKDRFGK